MSKEPPPRRSAWSRALRSVLHEDQFTAIEIAEVAEVSDRQVRKVANQKAALGHDRAEKVSRWLCRHHETRPSRAMLCGAYRIERKREGEANGIVVDDIADAHDHLTYIRDHYDELDKQRALRELEGLRGELRDLEAEINELE